MYSCSLNHANQGATCAVVYNKDTLRLVRAFLFLAYLLIYREMHVPENFHAWYGSYQRKVRLLPNLGTSRTLLRYDLYQTVVPERLMYVSCEETGRKKFLTGSRKK